MTLGNTTYLSSISPVKIKEKPSDKSVQVVSALYSDPVTSQLISEFRTVYKKEIESLDIKVGEDLKTNEEFNLLLKKLIIPLGQNTVEQLGFHPDLIENIALLTVFNAFIDLEDINIKLDYDIEFLANKDEIASKFWKYPYEIAAIIIPYNATRRQVKQFIDKNGKEMDEKINYNLSNRLRFSHIYKNSLIASEIIHLKDYENKSFSEISTILTDKYPDNEGISDESVIRVIYDRFKKNYWNLNPQINKK